MIEWYTFQALADEVGEDMATKVFRSTYPHQDYFRDRVIHRDQVLDQLALLQQSEEHNDDL